MMYGFLIVLVLGEFALWAFLRATHLDKRI
jgi:hypothetical protein